jgi:hypothetical protein
VEVTRTGVRSRADRQGALLINRQGGGDHSPPRIVSMLFAVRSPTPRPHGAEPALVEGEGEEEGGEETDECARSGG